MVHGGGRHSSSSSNRDNNNNEAFQSGSHGVGRHPAGWRMNNSASSSWGRRSRGATTSNNAVVIVNTSGGRGSSSSSRTRSGNMPRGGGGGWREHTSSWWRHRDEPVNSHRNVPHWNAREYSNSGNHQHDNEEDDYLIRQDQQPDGLWTEGGDDDDYHHEYYHYSTTVANRTPNYRCIGLVVSILVTTVLLALSGIRTTWILNVGESRRIETPILSRQITVSARSSVNKNVVVYDLAECPPLTGPPVTLQDDLSMSLQVDEYQYDYFFLNAGSSVNLTVHQSQGSSELYILEGANALRRLQTPSAADSDPFGKDAVVTGFASAESDVSLSYKVGRSDVYTIVYDNPSSSETSVLQAHYTAILTTYDLQGYAPICRDLQKDCHIHRPARGSCLLIQAPKDQRNKKKNPNDNLVTVKVRGQRRWLPILIYAIIPYLLGLLARKFCKPKSSYQMVLPNEQQAVAASAPIAEEEIEEANPPPTVPHVGEQEIVVNPETRITPSAPPAEEDVAVVAQPLTSVEVVGTTAGGDDNNNNNNDSESVPMVQAQVIATNKDWDEASGAVHKLT